MKVCAIVISIILICITGNSQDLHFSQFYDAPLLRNPALSGIFTGDVRIQGVYRDQWNSVTEGYRTGSLNGEYKLPVGKQDDFVTLGLQFYYDRAGTVSYTNTQVLPALNYHKSLSNVRNMYLSLGFMGGWVQHRIDLSKVTTNSQYDGMGIGENLTEPSFNYIDGSVGLSFNSTIKNDLNNNFFVAVAYHHFHRPTASFYKNKQIELNPKWVFSGGLRTGVTDYSYITLQGDYTTQGSFREIIFGGMYGYKFGDDPDVPMYTLHLGTFMRWEDALIPVIKLDYAPFSASFSYDVNISKLKPSSHGRGGFELSITFIKALQKSEGLLLCPRF